MNIIFNIFSQFILNFVDLYFINFFFEFLKVNLKCNFIIYKIYEIYLHCFESVIMFLL